MCSAAWLEASAVDGIVVESPPLLESNLSTLVVLFDVPIEHFWAVFNANFLTVGFNYTLRVVQEIISIDDSNADFTVIQLVILPSLGRPNLLLLYQEVEDSAKLIVASLRWHKIVEASNFIKWRNGASPVRWNAVSWMPNQKGEMELLQNSPWHDSRVTWFCSGVVWIRSLVVTITRSICRAGGSSIGQPVCLPVGANSFFDALAAQ